MRQRVNHTNLSLPGDIARHVFDLYADNKLETENAIQQLRCMGSAGYLYAAEICLDQSACGVTKSDEWFDRAEDNLRQTFRYGEPSRLDSNALIQSKSAVRLAELPLYRLLRLESRLPSQNDLELVSDAYSHVITAGMKLAYLFERNHVRDSSLTGSVIGELSEIAVLGLAQRYALAENLFDCWLPLTATAREDIGFANSDSNGNFSWDISIYTQLSGRPELTYKLQVKTSPTPYKSVTDAYSSEINLISVTPDLEVGNNHYQNYSDKIIQELYKEYFCGSSATISRRLATRTLQLLAKLD